MTDSECAKRAYVDIRYAVAPGSKPLPAWDTLQTTERELLIRMFIAGAQWACREITQPKP